MDHKDSLMSIHSNQNDYTPYIYYIIKLRTIWVPIRLRWCWKACPIQEAWGQLSESNATTTCSDRSDVVPGRSLWLKTPAFATHSTTTLVNKFHILWIWHGILMAMWVCMNNMFTQPSFRIKRCQTNFTSASSTNSVSRWYQILFTDIRLEAVRRVQVMCKMQVIVFHFTLHTFCCLLLHRSSMFEHILIHFARTKKSIPFRS